MSYEDYAKEIWEIYEQTMSELNDDDYEVDSIQMEKLIDAYEFFSNCAKESDGKVEDIQLVPKETTGHITAYYPLLYLYGDKLKEFEKIIGSMSALSLDCTLDEEVCVDLTIPGIFKRKA